MNQRPNPRPLAGRCIVVTRPAAQAEALMQGLRAEGAEPLFFPVIEIAPLEDTQPLRALAARLAEFEYAFFVSANAVAQTLAVLPRMHWPASLRIVTVGPGSARALQTAGFTDVLLPAEQFDSEGVLDLPDMQAAAVRGKRVLILRGNGGRELLASSLRERGADVEVVSCYRRVPAQTDPAHLRARADAGGIDALSFTSSEGARNFVALLGADAAPLLARVPCFVPHARIAAEMARLGAQTVRPTAAGDEALIAALQDYFR